jgi:ATP-dependent Clp protease ATP-binding subunit ClpA
VRRKPYSVILFDEIEKAHPDIMNTLLQILDDGRITDSQGRVVNFENTVIVMTSNAGSDNNATLLGFNKTQSEASKDKAMKALKEFLRPEFLGRVDEIVVFNTLGKAELVKIAAILIEEFRQPLKDKGIELKVGDGVYEIIADMSEDGGRGARDIRRTIRKNVEDKVANILIDNADSLINEIIVSAVDGNIEVSFK